MIWLVKWCLQILILKPVGWCHKTVKFWLINCYQDLMIWKEEGSLFTGVLLGLHPHVHADLAQVIQEDDNPFSHYPHNNALFVW